jgi:type II secretory pathway component PulK
MTRPPFHQLARAGSTLLLVMWALILLASAVLVWARWIQQDIALSGDANRQLEARAMAGSGVAMALHPMVSQQTPWLTEELAEGMGYKVQMMSEGGRLHLNWLLTGEDPRKLTMFRQWLEWKGVEFKDREVLIDSLLDYMDGDDLKRLNGVEAEGDYIPANRPLQTIEELEEVANTGH